MISCTNCGTPLNSRMINTNVMMACPSCDGFLRADVYPALFKELSGGEPGETILTDSLASCFFHQDKKAVIPCESCGRFLCALCDIEFNNLHMCPLCLEKGKSKKKILNLENRRTCYDTIALYLAIFPMLLFFWPTILTAPMVVFMTAWYWKKPTTIVPRTKIRYILAFLIAALQILGWIVVFVLMITR